MVCQVRCFNITQLLDLFELIVCLFVCIFTRSFIHLFVHSFIRKPHFHLNHIDFLSKEQSNSPSLHSSQALLNWASEASPTLGCSIEICVIYMCMCLSYVKLTM